MKNQNFGFILGMLVATSAPSFGQSNPHAGGKTLGAPGEAQKASKDSYQEYMKRSQVIGRDPMKTNNGLCYAFVNGENWKHYPNATIDEDRPYDLEKGAYTDSSGGDLPLGEAVVHGFEPREVGYSYYDANGAKQEGSALWPHGVGFQDHSFLYSHGNHEDYGPTVALDVKENADFFYYEKHLGATSRRKIRKLYDGTVDGNGNEYREIEQENYQGVDQIYRLYKALELGIDTRIGARKVTTSYRIGRYKEKMKRNRVEVKDKGYGIKGPEIEFVRRKKDGVDRHVFESLRVKDGRQFNEHIEFDYTHRQDGNTCYPRKLWKDGELVFDVNICRDLHVYFNNRGRRGEKTKECMEHLSTEIDQNPIYSSYSSGSGAGYVEPMKQGENLLSDLQTIVRGTKGVEGRGNMFNRDAGVGLITHSMNMYRNCLRYGLENFISNDMYWSNRERERRERHSQRRGWNPFKKKFWQKKGSGDGHLGTHQTAAGT